VSRFARMPGVPSAGRSSVIDSARVTSTKTDFYDGRSKRMRHIAPEPQMAAIFRCLQFMDSVSADLDPGIARAATGRMTPSF